MRQVRLRLPNLGTTDAERHKAMREMIKDVLVECGHVGPQDEDGYSCRPADYRASGAVFMGYLCGSRGVKDTVLLACITDYFANETDEGIRSLFPEKKEGAK